MVMNKQQKLKLLLERVKGTWTLDSESEGEKYYFSNKETNCHLSVSVRTFWKPSGTVTAFTADLYNNNEVFPIWQTVAGVKVKGEDEQKIAAGRVLFAKKLEKKTGLSF